MRAGLATVVAAALLILALGGGVASAQPAAPQGVTWQSAGDSFSSGEGVFGNSGACAQSDKSYGPAAAAELRDSGWGIAGTTFTACTGHLVEDYFNARADSGGKASLWDWGKEQGGPDRVDVITMSFGGNDVGFADVLSKCILGWPDSWSEFVGGGLASSLTGCDESEAELEKRVDALADPSRRDCTGTRRSGQAPFDCDLDIGDRRGSIIDFYYDVVTQRLTDRGRLYVVGYPRLFADVNQWPGWAKVACQGVKRGDTEKLGRLSERLNNTLKAAVTRANQALGSDRVVFVDRFALYRDGLHELCGTDADWLNGLSTNRDETGANRFEGSFHPNAAGHEGVTPTVVAAVDSSFPRTVAVERPGVRVPVPGGKICGDRGEWSVVTADMSCDEALRIHDEWIASPDKQGSSGSATVSGFACSADNMPSYQHSAWGSCSGPGGTFYMYPLLLPIDAAALSTDGIAPLKFGMPISYAEAVTGTAAEPITGAMCTGTPVIKVGGLRLVFMGSIDDDTGSEFYYYSTDSPDYSTLSGARVGMTVSEVQGLIPGATRGRAGNIADALTVTDGRKEVVFALDENEVVAAILGSVGGAASGGEAC